MRTVNMHEAKTNLSALVAAKEPFVLAKSGKPTAVVIPYDDYQQSLAKNDQRFGFMPEIKVPDDFDTMMSDEIAEMFGV